MPLSHESLIHQVATELSLAPRQVAGALALFDAGNTLPFIARYRKEATGALDEVQLRDVHARAEYLRELEERRGAIIKSIDEQGKLTPELRTQISAALTKQTLEDLYLPYKPKRRTRATIARERGLEPLAEIIWTGINGTASRETELLVRSALAESRRSAAIPVVVVSEAGATVYSASDVVREELPALRNGEL